MIRNEIDVDDEGDFAVAITSKELMGKGGREGRKRGGDERQGERRGEERREGRKEGWGEGREEEGRGKEGR